MSDYRSSKPIIVDMGAKNFGDEHRSGDEEIEEHAAIPEMLKMGTIEKIKREVENNRDKYISPPGALNLSPFLDSVRVKEDIPDMFFNVACVYDRIFVIQQGEDDNAFYGEGLIYKPVGAMKRDEQSMPRGILVSAGLLAMDTLRSHGMELGHMITFQRMSPWRTKVGMIASQDMHVMMLRDADITGSETLQNQLRTGEARVETRSYKQDDDHEVTEHVLKDKSGKTWTPTRPVRLNEED